MAIRRHRHSLLCALSALLVFAACSKPPPTFEEVPPADELYAEGEKLVKKRRLLGFIPFANYDDAIETFQTIIDNYPYSDYAVLAELAIADAYFSDAKYEEALSYYRDFTELHPQHEKVPYAIYRSALCHERRSRSANRDQTATREALSFLDQLLATYPYSEYADEGEDLWRELRAKLAEQIARIGKFYMKRHEWESAAERYRALLNEYPGLGYDAEALYRLGVCYQRMNRRDEAEGIFQAVVQNYQDTDAAKDAADRMASMN
ncbi:MAG: outer membrane protein assembly factor BamD [Myxococcota bacterium]|nr:outer membrane protein assembly factor BamD [Myxococcota bacterium]